MSNSAVQYTKAHCNATSPDERCDLATALGLKNLGFSVYSLGRGEGLDFFHNHREQEEVYFCIDGSADLIILDDDKQRLDVPIDKGDIVRVSPGTLRAIGNKRAERAIVIIAGACSHTFPAGVGHHDVIADVLSIVGHGDTGFTMPQKLDRRAADFEDDGC